MKAKMVDIIEDLDKGINIEQLVKKPTKEDLTNERTSVGTNEKDRD
jgi:hypothetical protein